MLKLSRREMIATPFLFVGPAAGQRLIVENGGGEKLRIQYSAALTESVIEDSRIANEVRRRYVERIRYLGSLRSHHKYGKEVIDHELAIYSELLGVQHALGGPSGWFPT